MAKAGIGCGLVNALILRSDSVRPSAYCDGLACLLLLFLQKLFAGPDTLKLRKTFDTKQVQSRKNVEPIKKPIEKGQRLDPMVVCFSVKASTGGRQDIHAHDIE